MSDKSDTPRTDALQEELASMNGPEGLYTEEMADRMWFLMAELEGKLTFLYANCIGDSMALGIMQLQRNELAQARAENDTLRGLLGNSAKPCPYCGLAAEDQAKCGRGFPGCSRADDQMLSKHFADGYRAEKAEAERDALREDKWRPIDTAPQDGSAILVCSGNWITTAHWHRLAKRWFNNGPTYEPIPRDELPTHWRPLPKPVGSAAIDRERKK